MPMMVGTVRDSGERGMRRCPQRRRLKATLKTAVPLKPRGTAPRDPRGSRPSPMTTQKRSSWRALSGSTAAELDKQPWASLALQVGKGQPLLASVPQASRSFHQGMFSVFTLRFLQSDAVSSVYVSFQVSGWQADDECVGLDGSRDCISDSFEVMASCKD